MNEESLHVLLIEDEISGRESLAEHLRNNYGYQVDVANDAAEVWRRVTKASRPYDAALIDDLLSPEPDAKPEPIGIELMEQIRQRCPETECIVFAGEEMDRALTALRVGAYRCLTRPLNRDELGMTIRMAVEQARLREERDLLSITLTISNAMVSGLDLDQTLRVISEATPRLVGAEGCSVARIDPASGQIQYNPMILIGNVTVLWQRHLKNIFLTQQIIQTGEAFSLSDVDAHANEVNEHLRQAGVKSFMGMPIPGDNQNLGVLYVYSTHREAFGTYEQRVLELLASQAAIALKNARLFEAETRRRQEAETLQETALALTTTLEPKEIPDQILTELQKVVPYDSASVQLLKDNRLEIIGGRGFPNLTEMVGFSFPADGDNPNREVLRRRECFIVSDAPTMYKDFLKEPLIQASVRGWLGVPMLVGGDRFVGMIALDKHQPRFYTEEHARLARAFATQAVLAIENSRLFDEANYRARNLETLQNLALSINSLLDLDEMLKGACQAAVDFFNADHSGLVLFNSDYSQGHTKAEYPRLDTSDTIIPLRGIPAEEQLIETQQPLIIHEVATDESLGSVRDILLRFDIQSILIVPVVAKSGKLLGSFSLDAVGRHRQFTPEEVELCQVFAAHVAVAVENARLFSKLVEAKKWRETLIENAIDAVIAIDQDKRVIVFNQRAEEMFGWMDREMIGETVARLYVDLEQARKIFETVDVGETITDQNVDFKHRDGTRIPALLSATLIQDNDGNSIGQAGFIRDLRQMTLLEERLRALIQVGQAITRVLELDKVLMRIVNSAVDAFPMAQRGTLYLYDELTDTLGLRANTFDYSPEAVEALRLRSGEGIAGWVFQYGQPAVVDDAEQDSRYKQIDHAEVPAHKSMVCVPLKVRGRMIGTLSLDNLDIVSAFHTNDLQLLSTFADQAAIAIENARLYENAKRHAQEMELLHELGVVLNTSLNLEEALECVAKSCQRLILAETSTALVYDERRNKYIQKAVSDSPEMPSIVDEPRQDGLTRHIIETGEPVIISDVAQDRRVKPLLQEVGVRSMIGIPIRLKEKAIGVLFVHSGIPHRFGEHEVTLLSFLANQAAIAITNAQYFDEIQTGLKQLQSLYEAGSAIISTMDPELVLKVVVEEACRALEGWRAKIVLISEKGEPTDLVAVGFGDGLDTGDLIRLDGISTQVITSGQPWHTEDVQKAPEIVNPAMLADGVRAAACVPFGPRDRNIGVMWIHYKKVRRFLPTEIGALRLYANQAAIAYDNARQMRKLEHFHQATEKLASVASIQEVLQQIVKSAKEVLGADSVVIWSYDDIRHTFLPDELAADGIEPKLVEKFREDEPHPGGTAEIVMNRNYLAVPDVDEPQYTFLGPVGRGLRGAIGVKAFQGIALDVGNETLGVLYVNYEQSRNFSTEDKTSLETFAYHAALTLKKARLLEQVSRARDTARIVAKVSVLENLESTLNSIVSGTCDALHCDAVTLCTYDQNRDEFGFPPAMYGVYDAEVVLKSGSITRDSVVRGILALEKAYYVADDAPSDPIVSGAFVKREDIKSSVGIPLKVGEHRVGVMFVNYRSRHRFTNEELTNIELFSHQAAVAIRNAQLYEETIRRANVQQALYEASKAVTGSLALDEILNRIVEQARRITSCYGKQAHFSHLALKEENMLVFRAAHPLESLPDLQKRIGDIDLKHNGRIGVTGRAIETQQPQLVKDVTQDPDYIKYDPETLSELAVPIVAGDQITGVINVEHSDPNAFGEEEQRALKALAAQAAVAIEHARLFRKTERRVLQLSVASEVARDATAILDVKQLLDETVCLISERFGFYHAAVFLLDEKGKYAVLQAASSQGGRRMLEQKHKLKVGKEGIVGFVTDTGKPRIALDVGQDAVHFSNPLLPDTRSEMALPLTVRHQVIGALDVQSTEVSAFIEGDDATLQIMADQLANAIENARLYERQQQETKQLALINQIAAEISSSLDLEKILQTLVNELARVIGAEQCAIALFDERGEYGDVVAEYLEEGCVPSKGIQIPLRDNASIELVRQTKRPLAVTDAQHDPILEKVWDIMRQRRTQSLMIVPIVIEGKVIGTIGLDAVGNPREFTDEEQWLAETIAHHAAIAIQSAQLYEDLQRIKGFVGSQTALDWIRMVSTVWGHSIKREVGTSLVCAELVRQAIQSGEYEQALSELEDLETRVQGIGEIPITAPLLAEDTVTSVRVHEVIKTYLPKLWTHPQYAEVELKLDLQSDLDESVTVRASEGWLRRGIEIMVDNAVQAMLDADSPEKRLLVTIRLTDDTIEEVLIHDTGPGIPDEIKEKLFKKPIDKPKGSRGAGIGLVLAGTIFEAYQGNIEVRNTGPTGTTMAVRLPLETNEQ